MTIKGKVEATHLFETPVSLSIKTFALKDPSKALLRVSAVVFLARPITISVFERTKRGRLRGRHLNLMFCFQIIDDK